MKKNSFILLLCLSIAVIQACKSEPKGKGRFEVDGVVTGGNKGKIYLYAFPFNASQPDIIDSATLGAKGNYHFSTSASEQGLYGIVVENAMPALFINDGDDITLNFNLSHMRDPEVDGSDATTQLYAYLQDFMHRDSLLSVAQAHLDTLQKQEMPKKDSILKLASAKIKDQVVAFQKTVSDEVENTSSPALALFIIAQSSNIMEPEALMKLTENTKLKYPQHTGVNILYNTIKQQVASRTETDKTDALVGKQAPELTMPGLDGKNISVSSFRGKYVLLDFWASWCGPCRQENPNVVAAYQKYKNKNFTVLGVSLDKEKASWEKAVKADHLDWPQMSDLKFWESAAVATYGFDAIPFNVLIDPQGKIIATSLRGEALEQKLAEVLE